MKLSICVTRYKEPWDVCADLFDSIALQRGINFDDIEVIIANDGESDLLDTSLFNILPFNARYISHKHCGVSATRNLAFDNSTGDYVMFCDCDDMFLNNCGLHLIFSAMNEMPDIITSSFVEEQYVDGTYKIMRHDKDTTFVHGKAFRKQFLIDEKLRFKEELTIHEDGYFNLVAAICAETKKEIATPFYLWKWNDNSVVRKNRDGFVLKTYENLMDCRIAICDELKERGYIDEYINCVVKTIVDSYYDFNKPEYRAKENKALRDKGERAFKKFYTKFHTEFDEANINRIAEIMAISRANAYNNGFKVEHYTIGEWLKHIVKDV